MVSIKLLKIKKAIWKGLFQFIILCSVPYVFPYSSYAQDNINRKGFTLGTTLGYGSINYEYKDINASEDTFALGLQVGCAITPKFIAGLEVNGWTIEAFNSGGYFAYYYYYYDEPSEGESISNVSMFLNIFPINNRPFYITCGIGKGYYEKYLGHEVYEDGGLSWFLGCGYEFPITKAMTFAPQFRYSNGNFHHGNYNVSELSIAFRYYFH